MEDSARRGALADFRRIPGVGPKIAGDLWDLGLRSVAQLAGADPEEMRLRLEGLAGGHVDRCMLYVLRCAVCFARTEAAGALHDPAKLRWWNWKD